MAQTLDYSAGQDPDQLNRFAALPNPVQGPGAGGLYPNGGIWNDMPQSNGGPLATAPVAGQAGGSAPQTSFTNTSTVTPPLAPPTTPGGLAGPPPAGGNFADTNYASAFVQYYANQPGANPSLKNDPNYWIGKITSGELGTDPNYIIQKFMTPEGAPAGGAAPVAGATGAGAGGGYVLGQGAPGQGTVFGANNPLTGQSNALLDELLSRSKESLVVDPNDPIIKAQTDAFNATQERSGKNTLSQIAEAGGPSTNMTAQTRSVGEQNAQADTAFQARLMGQEKDARRTEIQNALQGAYGVLTSEQQMQLQEELAQLGLSENAYQFDTTNQRVTALGY